MNYVQHDLLSGIDPIPRERERRELSGEELRDRALDLLESRRANYVIRARAAAADIYARTGGQPISVDDIRAECPPPAEIDGRVMGSILRPREGWRFDGMVKSERGLNHGKWIAKFVRRGNQ